MNLKKYVALFLPITILSTNTLSAPPSGDLYAMNFTELSKITYSTLSLTETKLGESPYAHTLITQKMIQQAGSRSLNEVLETYVPNFQKTQSAGILGLRGNYTGTISLGFQYMLMMVNGHARDSAQTGSRFEYDLIALEDIKSIEVIRSAGSATFGPGAYAGVINITTHNADSVEGAKVTVRQGVVDEFSSIQMQYGHKFNDKQGIYAFWGIEDVRGADFDVFNTADNDEIILDDFSGRSTSYRAGRPRQKVHFQYNDETTNIWARYTLGGLYGGIPHLPLDPPKNRDVFYYQTQEILTLALDKTFHINDELDFKTLLSYDWNQVYAKQGAGEKARQQTLAGLTTEERDDTNGGNVAETNMRVKGVFNWRPTDAHQIALGAEYRFTDVKTTNFGYPHRNTRALMFTNGEAYDASQYAAFIEHQWQINNRWSTFFSLRYDVHELVPESTFSPKLTVVYKPSDKNTLKFLIQRGHKNLPLEPLEDDFFPDDIEQQKQDSIEFIWMHHNDGWGGNLTIAYLDETAINDTFFGQVVELKKALAELELYYQEDQFRLNFSQGYTKLFDVDTKEDIDFPVLYTADEELSLWSDHISKLQARYDFSDELTVGTDLIYYWGDYSEQSNILTGKQTNDNSLGKSVFLNLNASYQFSDNIKLQGTAHHVMGIFGDEYNKAIRQTQSVYMTLEPSLSFTFSYSF